MSTFARCLGSAIGGVICFYLLDHSNAAAVTAGMVVAYIHAGLSA